MPILWPGDDDDIMRETVRESQRTPFYAVVRDMVVVAIIIVGLIGLGHVAQVVWSLPTTTISKLP